MKTLLFLKLHVLYRDIDGYNIDYTTWYDINRSVYGDTEIRCYPSRVIEFHQIFNPSDL